MTMSRSKPTDVMLRQLILALDRQSSLLSATIEAINRLAQSNDDIVAVLAGTQEALIEENVAVPERIVPTHLAQTLDDMANDLDNKGN